MPPRNGCFAKAYAIQWIQCAVNYDQISQIQTEDNVVSCNFVMTYFRAIATIDKFAQAQICAIVFFYEGSLLHGVVSLGFKFMYLP